MTKKNATSDDVRPTLLFTEIAIEGTTYKMCFNLGALAKAETELLAQGHDVNILTALPSLNLSSTIILFAASLRKFHPEIPFEDAKELLTLPYVMVAANAIADAWKKALPPVEEDAKANPTQAAE